MASREKQLEKFDIIIVKLDGDQMCKWNGKEGENERKELKVTLSLLTVSEENTFDLCHSEP